MEMEKEKIDYRKEFRNLYTASVTDVQEVVVPRLQFLMVDGAGTPESSEEFQNAIAALYKVAYAVKFGRKKAGVGPDFTIGPLEGLWWMRGGEHFDSGRSQDWRWTLMIMMPEFINRTDIATALGDLESKKPTPALKLLSFSTLNEGQSVQIMHIGPYDREGPTIKRLVDYAQANGTKLRGKHHEIYLGDPRRTKPEKLRTILRHPLE
jgi:hypothetical protein